MSLANRVTAAHGEEDDDGGIIEMLAKWKSPTTMFLLVKLIEPYINLISCASMVPPPSASKAVKIQLSLLSGELRSPTLFALIVTTWSCCHIVLFGSKYLIVLLETESSTVVVVEDFEERFGKHPVL